ncbi:hypothetical protein DsansV1_C16g0141801 [Dioscorea sansibarensis]
MPTPYEVFLFTHTKKHDRKTFIDKRSKSLDDKVVSFREASQVNSWLKVIFLSQKKKKYIYIYIYLFFGCPLYYFVPSSRQQPTFFFHHQAASSQLPSHFFFHFLFSFSLFFFIFPFISFSFSI